MSADDPHAGAASPGSLSGLQQDLGKHPAKTLGSLPAAPPTSRLLLASATLSCSLLPVLVGLMATPLNLALVRSSCSTAAVV